MHRQHLLGALAAAGAQCHAGFQNAGPGVAFADAETAVAGIGEIEQGDPVIAGQHDHRLAEGLLIKLDPHGQWHIEEMFLEIGRQTLGLGQ
ncbi:hypothetical protein D3C71_890080 [compost metagenome]